MKFASVAERTSNNAEGLLFATTTTYAVVGTTLQNEE